jgi:hypothetical protein
MFSKLPHRKILVTGPARSGTRICATMVAADTGLRYIDEIEIPALFKGKSLEDKNPNWNEIKKATVAAIQQLVDNNEFVLHCPPLMPWVHLVRNVLVIMMKRPIRDIEKSSRRIGIKKAREELEYNKLGYSKYGKALNKVKTHKPIAELKYVLWNKHKIDCNYMEVNYCDLANHPLWLPSNKRKNFRWNQTC